MDIYKINQPKQYTSKSPNERRSWLIFNKATISNLEVFNCTSTVDGKCTYGMTLQECIDSADSTSGMGYFVEPSSGKSICAHIDTSIHPRIDYTKILRNQSLYPALNSTESTVFLDAGKYKFPPNQANIVFYRDIMNLYSVNTGLLLGGDKYKTDNLEPIGFDSVASGLNIILTYEKQIPIQGGIFVPVQYGDKFNIRIPSTSLVLQKDVDSDIFVWIPSVSSSSITHNLFTFKIPEGKKKGDSVVYGDRFELVYGVDTISNDEHMNMSVNNSPSDSHLFEFVSKMIGFYCEDGSCKEIPIDKIERDGERGLYKGKNITRNRGCYGLCASVSASVWDTIWMYGFPAILISGTILVIILYTAKNRR
jgi:hypothetical protein